jgi:hypothetical protein
VTAAGLLDLLLTIAANLSCSVRSDRALPSLGLGLEPEQASVSPDVEVSLSSLDSTEWSGAPMGPGGVLGRYRVDLERSRIECAYARLDSPTLLLSLHLACATAAWRSGGLMLHATGLRSPTGIGVIGLAVSGGGKSTLTDLATWESLSDEIVIAHWSPAPAVSSTAFRSSAKKKPIVGEAPLGALLLLEKSPTPSFERVSSAEAFRSLANQAFRFPREMGLDKEHFSRVRALAEAVPAYRFRFPKSHEAAHALDDLQHELPPTNP